MIKTTTATKPSRHGELRDWKPGDGLSCIHADKAPKLIPCGKPVKSQVQTVNSVGRASFEKVSPLCANHSHSGVGPAAVMAQARKEATEQLVVDHWDEFQVNLKAAVDRLLNEAEEKTDG